MFQESLGPSFVPSVEEHRPRVATASVLQANSTIKPSKTCCYCGKNHPTEKCLKLCGSIQVNREKLKSAGLCFQCLLPGHTAQGCSVVCRKCNGHHHEIICGPPAVGPTSAGVSNLSLPPPLPSSGNVNASATHSSSTTSVIGVANSTPHVPVTPVHCVALCLCHSAWQSGYCQGHGNVWYQFRSLICHTRLGQSCKTKMGWQWTSCICFVWVWKPSYTDLRHIVSVNLQANHESDQPLLATAVDVIWAPFSCQSLGPDILDSFADISFADHYETGSVVKNDILIGMGVYWQFVLPKVLCSEVADLIAQNSVFGWIVSGCLLSGQLSSSSQCISSAVVCKC